MFSLITLSQFQVLVGRLSRLLDESMQQNHPAFRVDIEKHASDSAPDQAGPYFIETVAQRATHRHPDRPTKLNGLDVFADAFAILDKGETS